MWRTLRFGLRRLFNSDATERELNDEVQHLLDMQTAEYIRQGLSKADAERRARVEFGGVESVKEQVRSAGWEAAVESTWRDLRYALRGLARTPTFTVVVVATLALGVGANTAMFTVLNTVLLRPLPYGDPSRLTLLWTDDVARGLHAESTSYQTISDWRQQSQAFESIGYYSAGRATLGSGADGERTRAALVSGNLFHVLDVAPALGRSITEADDQSAAPIAVISHGLWQRRFNANPSIVGMPLVLDGWNGKAGLDTLTIVGVMPAGFYFADKATEIWTPAQTYWRWTRESSERFQPWARRWTGVGRLRSTASIAHAQSEMARIARQLASAHPSELPDFPGFAVNVVPVLDSITGVRLQRALWVLMAAVGLVLLVACANVANLLLSRGTARQQEFALRRALGASRFRLVRQQLIESLTLAAIGGAAGIAVAFALTRTISVLAASRVPRLDEISLDGRVIAFAFAASLAAAAVFGVFPALRVTMADRLRRATRPRGFLLVAECSLAVVLLVGAGLLLRSLALVHSVDPGFDPDRLLMTRIQFPTERPNPAESDSTRALRREQTQRNVIERVSALPDVEAAGLVDDLFVSGAANKTIAFPGASPEGVAAGELNDGAVSPGLFPAMRVPLLQGRYLREEDALTKIRALWTPIRPADLPLDERARRAIAEPVVVNNAFVKRYLPGKNPIGERFCIDPTAKTYWYKIVGVIGDMHRQGREKAAVPEFFGPFVASPSARVDMIVRTRGNPLAAATAIKQTIAAVIPDAQVPQTGTVADGLSDFSAQRTLQTWLLAAFAGLALLLAAIGIYGVIHYAVAQRTREIGVRIAIGARPSDVFARVIADGMRWPIAGIGLGLAAAAGAARVLSNQLFGIDAVDDVTFASVAIILLSTALLACVGPARRAARVDAITALRVE